MIRLRRGLPKTRDAFLDCMPDAIDRWNRAPPTERRLIIAAIADRRNPLDVIQHALALEPVGFDRRRELRAERRRASALKAPAAAGFTSVYAALATAMPERQPRPPRAGHHPAA